MKKLLFYSIFFSIILYITYILSEQYFFSIDSNLKPIIKSLQKYNFYDEIGLINKEYEFKIRELINHYYRKNKVMLYVAIIYKKDNYKNSYLFYYILNKLKNKKDNGFGSVLLMFIMDKNKKNRSYLLLDRESKLKYVITDQSIKKIINEKIYPDIISGNKFLGQQLKNGADKFNDNGFFSAGIFKGVEYILKEIDKYFDLQNSIKNRLNSLSEKHPEYKLLLLSEKKDHNISIITFIIIFITIIIIISWLLTIFIKVKCPICSSNMIKSESIVHLKTNNNETIKEIIYTCPKCNHIIKENN